MYRLLSLCCVLFVYASSAIAADKPNIVIMLPDNLGYGDIGAYGGGELRGAPTPNIDRLAAEGIKLTNFNVEPECMPSRSALLTGRLPIRSGTSRVPLPGHPQGMTRWEYTLAELLGDQGYVSGHFGKWHLGNEQGRLPNDQGFDEWWGFPQSSGETINETQPGFEVGLLPTQPIYEGYRGQPSTVVGEYTYEIRPQMDEMITDKSVAFINKYAKSDKPFFLYVPFSQPHAPAIPNEAFKSKGGNNYQNVLMEIDHNTGRILDALEQAGVAENTIVIWASDNGPETHQGVNIPYGAQGDSGPFRAEFPSAWEGALRTPGIIRWPGRIKAGRISNEIVSILDFYPTLATLSGGGKFVPTDRPIDGVDLTDFLLGKTENSPREHALFFFGDDMLAMKWRNFKVHFIVHAPALGAVRQAGQGVTTSYRQELVLPWVFDIEADPKELWNINASSTWVGGASFKYLNGYMKSLKDHPNIKSGERRE